MLGTLFQSRINQNLNKSSSSYGRKMMKVEGEKLVRGYHFVGYIVCARRI